MHLVLVLLVLLPLLPLEDRLQVLPVRHLCCSFLAPSARVQLRLHPDLLHQRDADVLR